MKVLVACEFSGRVRDAFIRNGHDAMSCDLEPTEIDGPHHQGDVFDLDLSQFDMMVAHPPCTFLTHSGVRWLKDNPERQANMVEAANFFKRLLDAPIEKIIIENPVPHAQATAIIGRKYDQIIHPWQHGHMEKKSTCLWLKGVDPLEETNNVKEAMLKLTVKEQNRLHWLGPSKNRTRLRSLTYQGIADAIGDQYGNEKVKPMLETRIKELTEAIAVLTKVITDAGLPVVAVDAAPEVKVLPLVTPEPEVATEPKKKRAPAKKKEPVVEEKPATDIDNLRDLVIGLSRKGLKNDIRAKMDEFGKAKLDELDEVQLGEMYQWVQEKIGDNL